MLGNRRQTTKVLLVGLDYSGPVPRNVSIETRGLCRPHIDSQRSAAPLYDYDVILINPSSYSHFIFGQRGPHSDSENELWDLKAENNQYDLDAAFDRPERHEELKAAIKGGTRVVWMMAEEKKISFFGWRSLYLAYLNQKVESLASTANIIHKGSKKLTINRASHPFAPYFDQLSRDGWTLCGSFREDEDYVVLASTPDNKALGLELEVDGARGWLLTPPHSMKAIRHIINVASNIQPELHTRNFHGIFLSHSHADKPFVRRLKEALHKRGVEDIWVDEAEIMVGDSLVQKIEGRAKKDPLFWRCAFTASCPFTTGEERTRGSNDQRT